MKKWEGFRDNYKKYVTKIKNATASGASGKFIPAKYKYYGILDFLSTANKMKRWAIYVCIKTCVYINKLIY